MVNGNNKLGRVDNQFLEWLEGINEERDKRKLKKLSLRACTLLIIKWKACFNLQQDLITCVGGEYE